MKFSVLTLFPDMFKSFCESSIIGRAVSQNVINIDLINIRDFSAEKHKKVDDTPYGGGNGMVMQCQPIYDAYKSLVTDKKSRVIFVSPRGEKFSDKLARDLAKEEEIIILCGHYEGVDQRVLDLIEAKEVSIGDYVLTGGELASMVIIDAVSRFVPGVLGTDESAFDESFSEGLSGLLEYPQYTRPEVFNDLRVPEVLLSGHHKNINDWRKQKSIEITQKNRPDLLK